MQRISPVHPGYAGGPHYHVCVRPIYTKGVLRHFSNVMPVLYFYHYFLIRNLRDKQRLCSAAYLYVQGGGGVMNTETFCNFLIELVFLLPHYYNLLSVTGRFFIYQEAKNSSTLRKLQKCLCDVFACKCHLTWGPAG